MTNNEPQAEYIPEIVNQLAQIIPLDQYRAEDLARMTPARKELFFAAHKAMSEAQEVEDAARQGDLDIREAIAQLSDLRAIKEMHVAPITPLDEWRRLVKGIQRPEPTPEAKAAADLADAQYATAEAELAQLRMRVALIHDAIPHARKFSAEQWARYHDKYKPKTADEVNRERLARQMERQRNGTDKPKVTERVILAPIDAPRDRTTPNRASRGAFPPAMQNTMTAKPQQAPWQVKPIGPRG